jgi:hypothetical protein
MRNMNGGQGFRGVVRVAALCVTIAFCALGALAVRACARGEEALLRVGEPLMQYGRAKRQSSPQPIELNGAAVFMTHGSTQDPVSAVLDQFEATCKESNGVFVEQWAQLERALGASWMLPGLFSGVFRAQEGEAGAVACFASQQPVRDSAALLPRLKEVTASGDLSKLGDVRYVRAERANGETVYLAMWTEGPVNVRQMFPKQGDAAGFDLVGVPRPSNARRLISVAALGHGEQLGVYELPHQSLPAATEGYRQQLQRSGFQLLETKRDKDPKQFFVATNGDRMLTVTVSRDAGKQAIGTPIVTLVSRPD